MKRNTKGLTNQSPSILVHLEKWKPLYNLLGHFFVFLAVMVGFIGLFISHGAVKESKRAVDLTQKALKTSENALKVQRDEFYLRNRPFLLVSDVKFSGPATSVNGKLRKNSVRFLLSNGSSIPANSILITAKVFINDKKVRKTILGPESLSSDIGLAALPPDTHTSGDILLEDEEYKAAQNPANKFRVMIEVVYSGILGEAKDKYKTSYEVIYDSKLQKFKMTKSEYI